LSSTPQLTNNEAGLKRELGARQMAMLAVGGSIGTGLLLGSGAAIRIAGPAVVLSYALGACIAFTVTMALGELACAHPAAGSFGVYAELYLNAWAGFVARYGYWLAIVVAVGAELIAAATYMHEWFPHVPSVVWIIAFALMLVGINLRPVGDYGEFEYWFAMIKVAVIAVFIVLGSALLAGGRVPPQYTTAGGFFPNGWASPLLATSFALFSFLGIEFVAIASGEARSTQDIGKATRIMFITLAFIYVGASAVLVGVMPWQEAGIAQSPFVTVFQVAGIPAASLLMNMVVLSAALSGANANIFAGSRMIFSLARSGYAPAVFGKLSANGSPYAALSGSTVGVFAAVLMAEFAPAKAFLYLVAATLFGGMLAWWITLAAHVRFRGRVSPERLATLPFRAPGGAALSVVGFVVLTIAVGSTWQVPDTRITILMAPPYLLFLSIGYLLSRKRAIA
jgi:L-asparagine transporter-like permease